MIIKFIKAESINTCIGQRTFKIVMANIVLFVLFLLLMEAGLRLMHIPYNVEWEPLENAIAVFDKELGWAYKPNLATFIDFEAYQRPVYTNEDGIRIATPHSTLSTRKPSVLFIGCSYTMGHGLSYEESFVGQFGALAAEKLQTVNLGVQAYGTDQSLLALKKLAPKYNAKTVIYTFMDEHVTRNGIYDRRMIMPDARFIGTKPIFALNNQGGVYLAKRPLLYGEYQHSWLADALTMKLGPRLGMFPPYPEKLTHELIREMERYCQQRKIRFILLNWRWNEQQYNNFSGVNVEKIDALQFAPPGWEQMRIPGDNHPDAAAGRAVAEYLYAYLLKSR